MDGRKKSAQSANHAKEKKTIDNYLQEYFHTSRVSSAEGVAN
jgi:hypothetical protein